MRKLQQIILLSLLLICSWDSIAQKVDFNKVVPPAENRARSFEEYLVQLAWNNQPAHKVLDSELEIAKKELELTTWDWTKDLSATFNYNEAHFINDFGFSDDDNPIVSSLIYPKFNFGATFNLGTVVLRKRQKKIDEEKIKIAEFTIDQQKLKLRAEILKRYEDYLLANEILKTRKLAEEDASQTKLVVQEMFKKDEASFDDFLAANTNYYSAQEATIKAESDIKQAELLIEEMIGIPFEDAERYNNRNNKNRRK